MKKLFVFIAFSLLPLSILAQEKKISYDFRTEVTGITAFNKSGNISLLGAHTVQGIKLGQSSFVGIGTGIECCIPNTTVFLPLFFQGEVGLVETPSFDLFMSSKIGVSINPGYNNFSSNIAYINPAVGFAASHLSVSLGLIGLAGRDDVNAVPHDITVDYKMLGFSLGISYRFR